MKYSVLLLLSALIINFSFGQNYNMQDGTYTVPCSGSFYDSGGSGGDYDYGESYTITFHSDGSAGSHVVVHFNTFNIEGGDLLCIYDGPNTASPSMGCNNSLTSLAGVTVTASDANATGDLTFTFTSDGNWLFTSTDAGWFATVSCRYPCQQVQAVLDYTIPAASGGYTDVCQGTNVTFHGSGVYPQSGNNYLQNDGSSTFSWDFGDGGTATGQTVTHTFANAGGYDVDLIVRDVQNCPNLNDIGHRVRVSTDPVFIGTAPASASICLGAANTTLNGSVTPIPWSQAIQNEVAGTTFLPDGTGVSYATSINFDIFSPGQTLTNVNDLQGICAVLEHSYLGDLNISITCPNGTTVTMKTYPGGAGQFLGVPIDDDGNTNPGTGWNYCWSPTPTYGTMVATASSYTTLPAGSYASDQPLSNLVGCPLNGNWTITVTDNLGSDNGYIFSWEINFNPALYPSLWGFTPVYTPPNGQWSGEGIVPPNGDNVTIQPTTTGLHTYTYTVTDDWGCIYDTAVTVNVIPAVTSSFNIDSINCYGNTTTITYAGTGSGASTYTWGFDGGTVVSGSGQGPYTVSWTTVGVHNVSLTVSEGGCSSSNTKPVFNPPLLSSTISSTHVACKDDCTGSVNFTVIGGVNPIAYNWSPPVSNTNAVCDGSYSVTATDGNGCIATSTFTITEPALALTASIAGTNVLCFGDVTGAANLTVTGGTPNYTYQWTGGALTEDISNIAAGIYTLTVTDANLCTTTAAVTITQPLAALTATITPDYVHCFGGTDGAINLEVFNGTQPYTYTWSSGPNTQDLTNIPSGNYTVFISDDNNCTLTQSTTVTQPAVALSAPVTADFVNCFGGNDGSIELSPAGGTTPYTFIWSNGFLGEDPQNLTANTYTVTVTDFNLCTLIVSATVTQPTAALTASIVGTNVLCNGGTNGAAALTVNGGTPPYSYNWTGGSANQNLNNIPSGIYSVTVTDINLCTATTSVTITQPPFPLTATITPDFVNCNGGNDGAADLAPSGGTQPYTYIWTNGAQTQDLSTITAGYYTVTITDANLCSLIVGTTVTEPALPLGATIVADFVHCFGGIDGSADLTVSDGTGPYSYSWSNGFNGEDLQNLAANTYSVTVTDFNLCIVTASATVTQPNAPLTATIAGTNVLCFGQSTGEADMTINGGTQPYSRSWSNGQISEDIFNIPAANYSVTVTDFNSCIVVAAINITQPSAPLTITHSPDDSICFGAFALLTVAAQGGTPVYAYTWKNPSGATIGTDASISVNPNFDQAFSVFVTDNNGCVSPTETINISVSPDISLSYTTENVSCFNACDGEITLNVTGGVPPINYSWAAPTTNHLTNICNGNYTVTVTDMFGCQEDTSYIISQPFILSYSIDSVRPSCQGNYDGRVVVTVHGGTLPYSYNWSNGGSVSDTLICGTGSYSVTVTDANNCFIDDTAWVGSPPAVIVNPNPTQFYVCLGQSAQLSAQAFGGTPSYTIEWVCTQTGGTYSGSNVNVALQPSGNYSFTVIAYDSHNCASNPRTVNVHVYPPITVTITPSDNTICPGDTISVAANISGGNGGPYLCILNDGTVVSPPFNLTPAYSDTTILYTLLVNDMCGSPQGEDDMEIIVFPKPNNDFIATPHEGCPPLKVYFSVKEHINGQKYLWNFHDDVNNYVYDEPYPTHIYNSSGTFDVSLSVTSAQGCKNTLTIEDMITVFPKPNSVFSANPPITSIVEPTIYFINLSSATDSSLWNFGDNDVSIETNPYHSYDYEGEYIVTLIAVSDKGCRDTTTLDVTIKPVYTFYAPTAFSPGKSSPYNDRFFVLGEGIDPNKFHLIIYDRWGEIMFETTQYDPENPSTYGWDGKVKGKNYVETGVYTWYVNYTDLSGIEHQGAGPITVIK